MFFFLSNRVMPSTTMRAAAKVRLFNARDALEGQAFAAARGAQKGQDFISASKATSRRKLPKSFLISTDIDIALSLLDQTGPSHGRGQVPARSRRLTAISTTKEIARLTITH